MVVIIKFYKKQQKKQQKTKLELAWTWLVT